MLNMDVNIGRSSFFVDQTTSGDEAMGNSYFGNIFDRLVKTMQNVSNYVSDFRSFVLPAMKGFACCMTLFEGVIKKIKTTVFDVTLISIKSIIENFLTVNQTINKPQTTHVHVKNSVVVLQFSSCQCFYAGVSKNSNALAIEDAIFSMTAY